MSAGRAFAALVSGIVLVALSSACTEEEILLATVPPGPRGGPPPDQRRCVDTSECAAQSFCARPTCDEIAGACEPRPVFCEEAAAPVCGCDGVTYWNDCLRRAAGVTAMMKGECTSSAALCKGGFDPGGPPPDPGGGPTPPLPTGCPPGTFCARLLPFLPPPSPMSPPSPPDACPPDVAGTCWALPAVCPPSAGSDRWTRCDDPNAPNPGPCIATCEAIRSGEPHHRAMSCF